MPDSSPQRILFLNQTFHPDPLATSQYLAGWAGHLAREGNDVTVLTGRRAYHDPRTRHPREEIWNGVRVVRVEGGFFGKNARWRRALDFILFLIAALGRGLFLPRPDVIVALTSPPLISVVAVMLARRHHARFASWVMDLNPDIAVAAGWLDGRSVSARILEKLSCWTLERADRVMALDSQMKERLKGKGLPGKKIAVVPLWMQLRFDGAGRDTFRRAHGWEKKLVVMVAGNHGACHPLETLLAAAAELEDEPRLHFCLVGGGTEWPRLRALSAERKNITLLDYVPASELAATLSGADLQVVIMGDAFVGMIHPCKIYNILGTERPFLYIGPARGPVADVIEAACLGEAAASFRHGESVALVRRLRLHAKFGPAPWPAGARTFRWGQVALLEEMTSVLEGAGR